MKIEWISQAGLLIETCGKTILVDPYLSKSCEKLSAQFTRRSPIDESLFEIVPDVIITTHNHQDHYDNETLDRFVGKNPDMLFFGPESCFKRFVNEYPEKCNSVLFNPHTVWNEEGIRFSAVCAEHSDPYAIGVVIDAEGYTLYITGDTLYNEDVIMDAPVNADLVFLPVNGAGNNMNAYDASLFADAIQAKRVVPFHIGTHDLLTPQLFKNERALYLEMYKKYDLSSL